MHKASISVTSEGVNRGATFALRVDTVPATQTSAPLDPLDVPEQKRLRVLLVEDHSDTRKVLALLLKNLGFDVTPAGSVKDALAAVERQPFDLLLSDIGLPDGSGTDVMRHVASRHNLKDIALSGYGQEEDLRRSREAGFATHLTKPVNLQALRDAIRNITG